MTAYGQHQRKSTKLNPAFNSNGIEFNQTIFSIEYQALKLRYSALAKQLPSESFDCLAFDYLECKANDFSDIDQVGHDFAEFIEINSLLDKELIAVAKLEWHWAMVSGGR
jgi:hypothetical protein